VTIPDRPLEVIWDITYACPLRCSHCYSESGRRASRQLRGPDLLAAADAIAAMRPLGVSLAGGEPLLVDGVLEVGGRLAAAGVPVALFTSGWTLRPDTVDAVAGTFFRVSVSVDGGTAEVHDRVRGRRGSFDRAMAALELLDAAAGRRAAAGERLEFGVDWVVLRSNADQVEAFCASAPRRFPRLSFLSFGAVVPEGLASRPGFAEHELLADEQVELLGRPEYAARLGRLAPAGVRVTATDNLALMMHPDRIRAGQLFPALQVEPDGAVRAMPAYEGTVGNVLTDPPAELWRRAVRRWSDPFVVRTLAPVRTMHQWAEATRAIDRHFGSAAVQVRLDRRPDFRPA
jgi:MoaA/NifB/PqqE/SkfB family radical SAM enzyme